MKKKFYTGVGSRQTPNQIQQMMELTAVALREMGFTLRSGGAQGADTAFENGADENAKIYYAKDATKEAIEIAKRWHPAWHRIRNDYVKRLHGRNAFQVLGTDLKTPSKFLVCWTPDGCESHQTRSIQTGGTGTAISIADANKIRIFNLANKESIEKLRMKLNVLNIYYGG